MTPRLNPPFWLDSNILVASQRGILAIDIAPGFWEALQRENLTGRIYSVEEIFQELTNHIKDDPIMEPLWAWSQARRETFFITPGQQESNALTLVNEYVVATYAPASCDEFLRGADPWLVAAAIAHGGSIVTNERPNNPPNPNLVTGLIDTRIKIPNVCRHFRVSTANLPQMMRGLGIRL